ncbi:MAG: glutathione S-transferase N-terminal domain-containing protein [Polyangiales bacterium]
MKLYYTPTSPFVRKVLVTAHELGLADRIETTFLRPSPTKADATLSATNPLAKIPALITDEGDALYDSPVIVEYLGSLASDRSLVPASGPERWKVLRTQALCDGILEAGILVFYERAHRPKELWWPDWLDGQSEKALQGLDALEREVAAWGALPDLGQVCAGVTLGWLEFRNVFGDLRATRPNLFAWYERFRGRPSMLNTEPHI